MSVAFRRESDEEHKEPRFELPIPAGPNLVTVRGLQMITDRLHSIECALAGAADEPAREALKREKRYWNTRQTTAVLAPIPSADVVAFGSRVGIRLNGMPRTIDIVGSDEADPAAGRIAFTAPLARSLIGAFEGEIWAFGGNEQAIEILSIDVIPRVENDRP